MNPTITQMVIKCHQQDIEAQAAQNRLIASASQASQNASRPNAASRTLRLVVASLAAAVAR